MNSEIGAFKKKVVKSFSNVKEDIDTLEKVSGQRYVRKEDYILLFNELKAYENRAAKELAELGKKIDGLRNSINDELEEGMELKEKTLEAIKKRELTRAELDKIKYFQHMLNEFKKEIEKIKEFENKNAKNEKDVAEMGKGLDKLSKRLEEFVYAGINIEDVEQNFMTRKDVEDEINDVKANVGVKIKELEEGIVRKEISEKEFSHLNDKIKSLKEDMDELNELLRAVKKEKGFYAEKKELNELKKSVLYAGALKEVEKDLAKLSAKVYEIDKLKGIYDEMGEIREDIEETRGAVAAIESTKEVFDAKTFEEIKEELKRLKNKVENISIKDININKVKDDVEKIKDNLILKREVSKILETNSKKFKEMREDIDKIEKDIEELDSNVKTATQIEDGSKAAEKIVDGIEQASIATKADIDLLNKKIDMVDTTLMGLMNNTGAKEKAETIEEMQPRAEIPKQKRAKKPEEKNLKAKKKKK